MTASASTKPGPQLGVPPSLEQVPVDRLHVDPVYQRATTSAGSQQVIRGMVREWNWALCQPLVVARRNDDALFVLDGQHRLVGARLRGDIPYLPCVILSRLDTTGEARMFVDLNTRRRALSQGQIFHGMLAAADPHAVQVQTLLDETQWRVRTTANTDAYKAGDLDCAPMLAKMLAAKGPDIVRFALSVLRAAYPTTSVRPASTMLRALFEIYDAVDDDKPIAAGPLIATLAAASPDTWIGRAVAVLQTRPGLTRAEAVACAINDALNGQPAPVLERPVVAIAPPGKALSGIAPPRIEPTPPRPAQRTTPTPASPFGADGKGWCTQCEQRRTRAAASACASRFCTLRRFT